MYDIKIPVKKSAFGIDIVLKAAFVFVDKAFIHLDEDDTNWIVNMAIKNEAVEGDKIPAEFENELLIQAVRLSVYNKTHVLRELLLARAMTSTFVDSEDSIERIQDSQMDIPETELEKILMDWFDKNEN